MGDDAGDGDGEGDGDDVAAGGGDGDGDGDSDSDGEDNEAGKAIRNDDGNTSMEPLRTTTTGLSLAVYNTKPFQSDRARHTIIARLEI